MSGVIYEDKYLENANLSCAVCGNAVYANMSTNEGKYHCLRCGKLIGWNECIDGLDKPTIVVVARHINGITINEALEFLLDELEEVKLFENQEVAEEFLLINGVDAEELRHYYFLDYNGLEFEDAEDSHEWRNI